MKSTKVLLLFATLCTVVIVACNTTKKTNTTTTTTTTTAVASPAKPTKPTDGIYIPGDEEFNALKTKYTDLTLDVLKQGHAIYTVGPCVNCHGAKSIYAYSNEEWKSIVNDMADRAALSASQKDAVYKYVLSIKATQGK